MSIIGYSNFALKKLPQPNELFNSNHQHSFDKRFTVKYNELDKQTLIKMMKVKNRLNLGSKRSSLKQAKKDDVPKIHECLMDETTLKCKICGVSMKWHVYGMGQLSQKLKKADISYYHYNALVAYIEKQISISFKNSLRNKQPFTNEINQVYDSNFLALKNFTDFKESQSLKDYSLFILGLPQGEGFSSHIKNLAVSDELPPENIRQFKMIGEQPRELEFFADFEGANMHRAYWDGRKKKVTILLNSDTNTDGYAKWFYFGCRMKCHEDLIVTFQILNCRKHDELIKQGMGIAVAKMPLQSAQSSLYTSNFLLWNLHSAYNIIYKESPHPRKVVKRTPSFVEVVTDFQGEEVIEGPDLEAQCDEILAQEMQGKDVSVEKKELYESRLANSIFVKKKFNSLSFSYWFKAENYNQPILFALTIPYTLSMLLQLIENIESSIKKEQLYFSSSFNKVKRVYILENITIFYEKTIIGNSLLDLPIIELTITSPDSPYSLKKKNKPYIFIIARQHPIESPSSYVCQGIIKFLIGNSPEAIQLRSLFVFKIIPMVNPDGVTVGNSRTSLEGLDLNRCWKEPSEEKTPEVFCVKERIKKKIQQNKQVFMFFDLHGQQSELNAFLLATCKEQSSTFEWAKNNLYSRLCADHCKFFNLSQSKSIPICLADKMEAREVIWSEFKVEHSYSVETSFYGWKESEEVIRSFDVNDFEQIGQTLCKSILQLTGCQTLMEEQLLNRELKDMTEEMLLKSFKYEDFQIKESGQKDQLNKGEQNSEKKLNKFQQSVLKSSQKLRMIFQEQKGLNWNEFYKEEDLITIKEQAEKTKEEIATMYENIKHLEGIRDSDPEDDYKLENKIVNDKKKQLLNKKTIETKEKDPFEQGEDEQVRGKIKKQKTIKSQLDQQYSSDNNSIMDDSDEKNETSSKIIKIKVIKRKKKEIIEEINPPEILEVEKPIEVLQEVKPPINQELNLKEYYLQTPFIIQKSGKHTTPVEFDLKKTMGFQSIIKLKNPFLPTQAQILEEYSLKPPKMYTNMFLSQKVKAEIRHKSASISPSRKIKTTQTEIQNKSGKISRSNSQKREQSKSPNSFNKSANINPQQKAFTSNQTSELNENNSSITTSCKKISQITNTTKIPIRKIRPSTSQSRKSVLNQTNEDNLTDEGKNSRTIGKASIPDSSFNDHPYHNQNGFFPFSLKNRQQRQSQSAHASPSAAFFTKISIPYFPSKQIIAYRPLSAANDKNNSCKPPQFFNTSLPSQYFGPQQISQKMKQLSISKSNVTQIFKNITEQKSDQTGIQAKQSLNTTSNIYQREIVSHKHSLSQLQ